MGNLNERQQPPIESAISRSVECAIMQMIEDCYEPIKPLSLLAFRKARVPGRTLLHQLVIDHYKFGDSHEAYFEHILPLALKSMRSLPVNEYNANGFTAMHLAAMKNDYRMIKHLLLNLGEEIDLNCRSQTSIAVKSGFKGVFSFKAKHERAEYAVYNLLKEPNLLSRNERDCNRTALEFAVIYRFFESVRELLKSPHIEFDYGDSYGFTAFHLACGNVEMLKELLKVPQISINQCCANGTPLHLAAAVDCPEVIKVLLNTRGILVNSYDSRSLTALHIAAKRNSVKAMKELLNAPDIQVNSKSVLQITPLHMASMAGNKDGVEMLLKMPGILVNELSTSLYTPLHLACKYNRYWVVKELLECPHVLLNLKNSDGDTPFHLAVSYQHAAIVALLLKVPGIAVNARNKYHSPFQTAIHGGFRDVVEVLLRSGKLSVYQRMKAKIFLSRDRKVKVYNSVDQDITMRHDEQWDFYESMWLVE